MVSTASNSLDIAYYAQELLLCITLGKIADFSNLLENKNLNVDLTEPENLVALCETLLDADGRTLLKAATQKGDRSFFAVTLKDKYTQAKAALSIEQAHSEGKLWGSFFTWPHVEIKPSKSNNKEDFNLRRTYSDPSSLTTTSPKEKEEMKRRPSFQS